MSTKHSRQPRKAKAFAVEGWVKEGKITSSPGCNPQIRAAISRLAVQEGVSKVGAEEAAVSSRSQAALPANH